MITSVKTYLKFLRLLIKRGRFRHSGYDFNLNRLKNLNGFEQYIHQEKIASPAKQKAWVKKQLWKNALLRNILAQGAFIKNAWKQKGGHLEIPVENLFYIRIPKSASTSICYEILSRNNPELKQQKLSADKINAFTDIFLKKEISKVKTCSGFTVVRNPFARLVSVYREVFESRKDEFFRYQDYLFGILQPDLTFEEFVFNVTLIPDWLKDQHIKPQHLFLKPYEANDVAIKVFKLEDQGEALRIFLQPYSMGLPHINKSEQEYDYRNYFNAATLDAAYKMYKVDVEKFGYEKEYIALTSLVARNR